MSEGVGRRAQSAVFRAGVFGRRPRVPVAPDALERAARRVLDAEAFAYLAGGAGTERTMAANRTAFDRWELWPRPLRDVAERDLGIRLLGRPRTSPLLLAPLGVMELVDEDGDVAAARAAAALGIPVVLSGQASRPLEEVAAETPGAPRMLQLYWSASDELNRSFLERAEAAGCEAIVVTVDTHLLGWRTRDLGLGFLPFTRGMGIAQYTSDPVFRELVRRRAPSAAADERLTPAAVRNGVGIARRGARLTGFTRLGDNLRSPLPRAAIETFLDVFATPTLTWDDLARAREWTRLPLIVKGVLHPDDAERAIDAGLDGVWVSNHGGRQVDRAVASLDALPGVAERVGGRVPIILDSGVRTGAEVLIALALGADAVALGRPWAYGLAVGGEAGVAEVLRNVLAELDITLGLVGRTGVEGVDRSILRAAC